MSTDQPKIPDFNKSESQTGKAGPSHGHESPWDKKKIAIAVTILLAVIVPIVGYYVYNTKQTTESEAAGGLCHNGQPPANYITEPRCYAFNLSNDETMRILNARIGQIKVSSIILEHQENGSGYLKNFDGKQFLLAEAFYKDNAGKREILAGSLPYPKLNDPEANRNVRLPAAWAVSFGFCSAPRDQMCKKKSIAEYECRPGGFIGPCGGPTPTPTQNKGCTSPQVCVDQATALAQGCNIASTNTGSGTCALPNNPTQVGFCCEPKDEPKCEAPRQCITVDPNNPVDPATLCKDGTIDKLGSSTCSSTNGQQGICCERSEPTPTPTNTPTPTVTPTVTPTPSPSPTLPPGVTPTVTPTPSPTPPVTLACILPTIEVEVECATCGGN